MAEEDNNFNNFSLYSSANFQDADETRPASSYMEAVGGGNDAIQNLVNYSFQRHISERKFKYFSKRIEIRLQSNATASFRTPYPKKVYYLPDKKKKR